MAIPHDWDQLSMFQHKYNIPSIKLDHARWDKRWEKTLRKLSASKDVFPMLSPLWREHRFHAHRASPRGTVGGMSEGVCRTQKDLLRFEKHLEESEPFVIAWLILDEEDRKRHLFKGMKEACQLQAPFHCDGRALCPEITTTKMLKQNGKAFTNFTREYMEGVKEAGAGNVYLLLSEWWSSAVTLPEPWPEDVRFAFTQLSLQRNEFISQFLAHTTLSILGDLHNGNHGMEKIRDVLEADGDAALVLAAMRSSKRDKPLIRCQNCTKTPQEIEGNPKFMVCSICKSELDFVVHYCSRTCQKEDWGKHKKHCGQDKIAKKLPGTIHDPNWEYPIPPQGSHYLAELEQDGEISITSLGFGPLDPSHPRSLAFQRQLDLLEHDRDADYFLFDDADHPIRFILHDTFLKMCFRTLRSEAMFGPNLMCAGVMAEHLIKMAGGLPGLSKAGILAQFESEHGGDVAAEVAELEALGVERGYEAGKTFFEVKCANIRMLRARELSHAL